MKTILFLLVFQVFHAYSQDSAGNKIIWTADWSHDDKYIAVGGNLEELIVYRGKNLKTLKTYPIHGTITCVKWHPNKNIIAIGTQISKNKVCILDFDTDLWGVSWNKKGNRIATTSKGQSVLIWNKRGRKKIQQIHDFQNK